jgi:DNA-binding LacI/PurR family transcriptional regulator
MSADGQTERSRRPTLKDVAAAAGVSLSTASLAFSGKGPVAAATVRRVHDAAAQIGYAGPDPIAASLRRGRADSVAVVVEHTLPLAFHDPFALTVLGGLAEALDGGGSSMLLVAQDPAHPDRALAQLMAAAVDAAIFPLCGLRENPLVDALAARGIPVLGTGAPLDPRVVHVLTDERGAMRLGAQHLADLGHTRVGHVAMPLGPGCTTEIAHDPDLARADYPDAGLRAIGFADVFGSGAPVATTEIADVAHGELAAGLLLDAQPRLTGLVCQSDLLAAGAIRAAASRGLRVPTDLSVVGFDGVDLPWIDAELTTVVQNGHCKGRELGERALALASGEDATSTTLNVQLRGGATSAPPRSGRV